MTQFKGVANTFDNNENLTSDGVRTFKYDAFNRIIEVKIGTIILAEYQYDAFNRRVVKKVDADLNGSFETITKFLYDGFRCIEELNGSDILVQGYVYGSLYIDEVILQRTGATDYYFTHDYRYSVTSLTNTSGSIVESYEYKVYGERTASGAGLTDVGYTGQRLDNETELMYFKNRCYSVDRGSFVTMDPLGYVDGMSRSLGYFGGSKVDPMGLFDIEWKGEWDKEGKEKKIVEASLKVVEDRIKKLFKQINREKKLLPKGKCYDELRKKVTTLKELLYDVWAAIKSKSRVLEFRKEDIPDGEDGIVEAQLVRFGIPLGGERAIILPFRDDRFIVNKKTFFNNDQGNKRDETVLHELTHIFGTTDKGLDSWNNAHDIDDLMSQDFKNWRPYFELKKKADRCDASDFIKKCLAEPSPIGEEEQHKHNIEINRRVKNHIEEKNRLRELELDEVSYFDPYK